MELVRLCVCWRYNDAYFAKQLWQNKLSLQHLWTFITVKYSLGQGRKKKITAEVFAQGKSDNW